jgi:hypothetical protein
LLLRHTGMRITRLRVREHRVTRFDSLSESWRLG